MPGRPTSHEHSEHQHSQGRIHSYNHFLPLPSPSTRIVLNGIVILTFVRPTPGLQMMMIWELYPADTVLYRYCQHLAQPGAADLYSFMSLEMDQKENIFVTGLAPTLCSRNSKLEQTRTYYILIISWDTNQHYTIKPFLTTSQCSIE